MFLNLYSKCFYSFEQKRIYVYINCHIKYSESSNINRITTEPVTVRIWVVPVPM